MTKKIWVRCSRCDGCGVNYIVRETYKWAKDCPDCLGVRGWLIDPKYLKGCPEVIDE